MSGPPRRTNEYSAEPTTVRYRQRLFDCAAVKHAADWLLARNVEKVYVGDLTNVLSTHWPARVNEKTHAFWSHGRLVDRLELEYMTGKSQEAVNVEVNAENHSVFDW